MKLGGAANEAIDRQHNNCVIVKIPPSRQLPDGATALMATQDIDIDEECLVDYGDGEHQWAFRERACGSSGRGTNGTGDGRAQAQHEGKASAGGPGKAPDTVPRRKRANT